MLLPPRFVPVVLGVIALAAVLGCAGCARGPASPLRSGAPAQGAGTSGPLPFAGDVPWNSAVLDRDGRTLHFLADWDHIQGGACARPTEATSVRESATSVTITVLGYAEAFPPNVNCGGVGYPLQPKTVVLARPLGARPLVDAANGARRAVLADATVPTLRRAPSGYESVPMTWAFEAKNEHTASRVWRRGAEVDDVFLRLTAGLPTTYSTFIGPAGPLLATVSINGDPAHVYRSGGQGQVVTTVRWTTVHGQELSLESFGTTSDHMPLSQVIALARSVA